MNGHVNCILAVCCPPDSDGQREALAEEIKKYFGWDDSMTAYQVSPDVIAGFVLENFDLAPKGSLQAFKDAIRDLAREGYVKAE